MHAARRLGGWLVLLMAVVPGARAAPIPDLLEPWREWVLHGHEDRLCPVLAGGDETACAWPGELRIEAGDDGATFTQRWTTYRRGLVPLPGYDGDLLPIGVQVDGRAAPVALVDGVRRRWSSRPAPSPCQVASHGRRVRPRSRCRRRSRGCR